MAHRLGVPVPGVWFGAPAFRAGRSLGVQFRPEITTAVVHRYPALGGTEQCVRHGVDPEELPARGRALESTARDNAGRLTDAFLDRVATASA
ncbi:hypothetical protein [Streptomyces pseudovenezuelae]|uniref:Uncharacterized protein n=1 Tax=Streptomyces pseudovenezuelae TaxID=67350 RepID=A0A117PR67_9ACTN|nr:hypothetical protein [Streptomyces pseudovenezuelae]KUM87183.1 hypothetical protein AQI94_17680 [Streptomyces pseudovenezuelae]